MKIRRSFVIRWLLTLDQSTNERSVIDIEHIQSGQRQVVSSLEEASEWMKAVTDPPVGVEELKGYRVRAVRYLPPDA